MRHAFVRFRSLGRAATLLAVFAAGCNGGAAVAPAIGTGASPTPSPSAAPLPASAAATLSAGAAPASISLGPVAGGYSSTIAVPAGSAAASVAVTLTGTQPAGTPAVQTAKRRPQTIGGTGTTAIAFVTLTSSATVTFGATPTVSFTVPAGAASLEAVSYVALYDPTANPQPGWTTLAGPGTVNGTTITFNATSAALQLKSGVTYDLVFFTVAGALPTPSPAPTATPAPTPAPTATPVAGAQHLYMVAGTGSLPLIFEYALPLTPNSTPALSVPLPVIASDSELGPGLAVNAKHVIYTDVSHDAYEVFDQPLIASSKLSAIFCDGPCGTDHPNNPSIVTLALSPFDFLAATDSGGPIASPFVHFFDGPFASTKGSTPPLLTLPGSGSGLTYDAAGNLYAGGGSTPTSGDLEVYGGNIQLAHLKLPIFITSVAVNANELAVLGSGNPCSDVVLLYALPLTSTSMPFATISNGVGNTCGGYVALDAAGNLYVNGSTAGLSVYTPPLTNSSSPSTSIATGFPTQIVIGP
jgi:hypothetical protein